MLPFRKSPRKQHWDYSTPGYYLITSATRYREDLFGSIENQIVCINDFGYIVYQCWNQLADHYSNIELDEFIVMPDHIHGIIKVSSIENIISGEGLRPSPEKKKNHNILEIVRAFKSFSSRRINQSRNTSGLPVWQRSFHDYYIFSEKQLNQARKYIRNNPSQSRETEFAA